MILGEVMRKTTKLLSICITSYNRVEELRRCIQSIKVTDYFDEIEIVISEDHSEKRAQIEQAVQILAKNSELDITYNSNPSNLGYDRNLAKLISLAKGKYILFLSDDDSIIDGALDGLIRRLRETEYSLIFTPFRFDQEEKRKYAKDFKIPKGIDAANKYVYEAILFSGLVFRREFIANIDAERFLNTNYFQVYLFLATIFRYNSNYLNILLINCNGDGENAFGKSESSEKNQLLADRGSIFSNLEFHKGLIKAIKIFEEDFSTEVLPYFSREYCIRAYPGMARAKKAGYEVYFQYWNKLNSLDIKLKGIIYFYHYMLIIFGAYISNIFIYLPRITLLWLRANRKSLHKRKMQ